MIEITTEAGADLAGAPAPPVLGVDTLPLSEASVSLIKRPASGFLAPLAGLRDAARDFARASKAENTQRAYRADWADFAGWCGARGFSALPAAEGTLSLYVAELAESHKPSTITRRLSAISQAHQVAGMQSPTRSAPVRAVMAGIRRVKGTAAAAKAPTLTDDIRAMVAHLPAGLLGARDRALLLIGFAGAFRRSELVALDRADCEFDVRGLTILIRRSKTDQEAQGRKIGIPYGSTFETCPLRSLQAWLGASGITEGPLFRHVNRHGQMQPGRLSDRAVALIVKRYAVAAGLDVTRYSGHSLRAGFATSAAIAGASERSIMAQTGHRSTSMLRRYIRDANLFRDLAAAKLGL